MPDEPPSHWLPSCIFGVACPEASLISSHVHAPAELQCKGNFELCHGRYDYDDPKDGKVFQCCDASSVCAMKDHRFSLCIPGGCTGLGLTHDWLCTGSPTWPPQPLQSALSSPPLPLPPFLRLPPTNPLYHPPQVQLTEQIFPPAFSPSSSAHREIHQPAIPALSATQPLTSLSVTLLTPVANTATSSTTSIATTTQAAGMAASTEKRYSNLTISWAILAAFLLLGVCRCWLHQQRWRGRFFLCGKICGQRGAAHPILQDAAMQVDANARSNFDAQSACTSRDIPVATEPVLYGEPMADHLDLHLNCNEEDGNYSVKTRLGSTSCTEKSGGAVQEEVQLLNASGPAKWLQLASRVYQGKETTTLKLMDQQPTSSRPIARHHKYMAQYRKIRETLKQERQHCNPSRSKLIKADDLVPV